jgi:hypothetical protein
MPRTRQQKEWLTMELLIFALLVWVLPISVAHSIGKPKNREGFLYGLLLGWLGVLIVALLPARHDRRKEKQCPDCLGFALNEARACRHCGHRFEPSPTTSDGHPVRVVK